MSTANDTIIPVEHKLEAYVTNLTPGKTYNLRVLAYSNGGDGRMSSPPFTFQMGEYHSDAYGYYVKSSATRQFGLVSIYLVGFMILSNIVLL